MSLLRSRCVGVDEEASNGHVETWNCVKLMMKVARFRDVLMILMTPRRVLQSPVLSAVMGRDWKYVSTVCIKLYTHFLRMFFEIERVVF